MMKTIKILMIAMLAIIMSTPIEARNEENKRFLNALFGGRDYPVALSQSPAYPWRTDYKSVKTTSRQDDVNSDCWFSLDVYVPEDSATVTFDYRVRYHKETYGYAKYANLTCLIDDNEVFRNNGTDKTETATIKIGCGYHTLKWNLRLGEAWENWDYFSAIENMRFEGISDEHALPEYSKPFVNIWSFPDDAVTDTIVIENIGKEDFIISELDGLESPFYIKSSSDVISSGKVGFIVVGYEPQDEGCHEQTLTIISGSGKKRISCSGVVYETEPVCNNAPGRLSEIVGNTGVEMLSIFGSMNRADNYHLAKFKGLKYLDLRGTDMEYIFNGGINNLYELEDILLPPTLKYIDYTWFQKHWDRYEGDLYYNIRTITCMSPEPPQLISFHGGSDDYSFDGLRDDVIVYVPAQYVTYYESDEKWGKLTIMPVKSDSKTIRVVMSDSVLADYSGCYIELFDRLTERTQRLTVGNASEYVFHNVKQDRFYSVSLLHPSRRILASKDSVKVGGEKGNVVRLDAVIPLYKASCEVLGNDKEILTDRVQVSWGKSDGDKITGSDVRHLMEGDTIVCTVSLPKLIGLEYVQADTVCHVVNAEDNKIIIQLVPHEKYIIKGRVIDSDNKPLRQATITLSQTLNGNLPWTKTLRTDENGKYEGGVYSGPVIAEIASDKHFSVYHKDTISCDTDWGERMLSICTGRKITVDMSFVVNRLSDGEISVLSGYDEWKELDFYVSDSETGIDIENVKVEYPYIYIVDDLGDTPSLKVRVTSRKKAFRDIEVYADNLDDGNFSAKVQIVEYGDVKVSCLNTDCDNVAVLVYDMGNNLVHSGILVNDFLIMRGIADGNYRLVAIESNELYNNVSDFSYFENFGLIDGQDYICSSINISSGLISEVVFDKVPRISLRQNIVSDKTYIVSGKNTVVAGNYFTVKTNVDIKPEYIGRCKNFILNFVIPDSCRFVPNSLLIGTTLAAFNFEGRTVEIPIQEDSEIIRFCVLPMKGGPANVSASLTYELDGKTFMEPIGGLTIDITGVSLNVMPVVQSSSVIVSGTGIANSDVEIIGDGRLLGRTTVLANGNWKTTVELCTQRELKTHSLYSRLTTPDGNVLYSETKKTRVNSQIPYVRKVEMINTTPSGNVTVFDFDNPFAQKSSYSYNPSYPAFTFKVWFKNLSDPVSVRDAVLWVKTTDGKDIPIELVVSEADSCLMIGSRAFPSSWSLPSNVAITLNNIDNSVLMPENVLDIMDENMSSADIADIMKDGDVVSYSLISGRGDFMLLCGGAGYETGDDVAKNVERIVSRFGFKPLPGDDTFLMSPSKAILWLKKEDKDRMQAFFLYDISAGEEYNSVMSMLSRKIIKSGQERVQYDMTTGYFVPNRSNFTLSSKVDNNMKSLIDLCNKKLDCVEKLGMVDRDYAVDDLKATLDKITGLNLAMVATVVAGTCEIASNAPRGTSCLRDALNSDDMLNSVANTVDAVDGISDAARKMISNLNRYPSECGLSSAPDYIGTGVTPLIDPSGYVYEAVESNRLEGVKTTAYFKTVIIDEDGNPHEHISLWEASEYEQNNPLYTDAEGRYSWDVPAGLWQVKYEKDGYEPAFSEWLPVPPPQMEVNVGMSQLVNPYVVSATAYTDSVCFSFSKYMAADRLTYHNIAVSKDGEPVDGELKLIDMETTGGKNYVSKVMFVPNEAFELGDSIELSVSSKVKSYAGCPLVDDYFNSLVVSRAILVTFEDVSDIAMGDTVPICVRVSPAKMAAGQKLYVAVSNESIVSVDKKEIDIDESGLPVVVNVNGVLPGVTVLKAGIESLGVEDRTEIQVHGNLIKQTYAPWATIESGTRVDKGTKLYLFCATPNASVYYTLDGTCPCDEFARILYNPAEGIDIDSDVTVKTCAVAEGMSESEVNEYVYSVNTESGVELIRGRSGIFVTPSVLSDSNAEVAIFFDEEGTATVEIYDIQGSRVGKKNVSNGDTVSFAGYPDGIYIISVNKSGKRIAAKVTK